MNRALLSRTAGIALAYANRHCFITGPTGSGKTVSLMRLAEQFAAAGVPVFATDVKGDLAALARSQTVRLHSTIPLTVKALGADLMARALELSDAQAGNLDVAFAYAADTGTPLLTLGDLKAVLRVIGERQGPVSKRYGLVSQTSTAAILRAIMTLGSTDFRAPAFDVADLMSGVNILDATELVKTPRLYAVTLLWMLKDLNDRLPEIGDMSKPRLVFFFDEAHLLFSECPTPLLRKIESIVRLIRSKGVGIFFATQRPADIPMSVRDQLAYHVEHDRGLPIGSARLSGLTTTGLPMLCGIQRVELPACPLGALSTAERRHSAVTLPEPLTAPPQVSGPVLFYVLIAAALTAAVVGWYLMAYAGPAWWIVFGMIAIATVQLIKGVRPQ